MEISGGKIEGTVKYGISNAKNGNMTISDDAEVITEGSYCISNVGVSLHIYNVKISGNCYYGVYNGSGQEGDGEPYLQIDDIEMSAYNGPRYGVYNDFGVLEINGGDIFGSVVGVYFHNSRYKI